MKDTLKKFMNEYKHLQQFYKTKKEFKQHLLSGEVAISIPDMINFSDKQVNFFKNNHKKACLGRLLFVYLGIIKKT